jgi:hypothetical protein
MGGTVSGHVVRPRSGTGKAGSTRSTGGKNGLKPRTTHPSLDQEAKARIASNDIEVSKPVDALSATITIISPSSSLTSQQLQRLIQEGEFVGTHNGKPCVWKTNFYGNQHVKSTVVAAQKVRFVRTAQAVRGLSGVMNVAGGGLSIYLYVEGEIGEGELVADLVFSAIAFVPPYGWVVSGIYFMGKEATKEAIRFANREDVQQSVRIVKKLVNNDPRTWWWFIRRLSRY